jgi:GntR family transcriptional regulator
MSRAQPGAVILDQLRDRIVTGLYFGNWQPGERLPSIRDIADAESVDRKTAAAAYHRLEEEGLVEVKARSGVFLRDERDAPGNGRNGPLERLQKRWLKNTYDGARALGLETDTVLRLFHAVADVEAAQIPVLEEDEAAARTVAHELRECVGINARPVMLQDVANRSVAFGTLPFAITTPYHAQRVAQLLPRTPIIVATLSLDLLHGLLERAEDGPIMVIVPSAPTARRVEAALRQKGPSVAQTRVVVANRDIDLVKLRGDARCVYVWPGCEDVLSAFAGDDCVKPVRLLSEATLDRVRTAVLEAALHQSVAQPAAQQPIGAPALGTHGAGTVRTASQTMASSNRDLAMSAGPRDR